MSGPVYDLQHDRLTLAWMEKRLQQTLAHEGWRTDVSLADVDEQMVRTRGLAERLYQQVAAIHLRTAGSLEALVEHDATPAELVALRGPARRAQIALGEALDEAAKRVRSNKMPDVEALANAVRAAAEEAARIDGALASLPG